MDDRKGAWLDRFLVRLDEAVTIEDIMVCLVVFLVTFAVAMLYQTGYDMTLKELEQVYTSLLECGPDNEHFSWGTVYENIKQRRETALKIIKTAIEEKQNEH